MNRLILLLIASGWYCQAQQPVQVLAGTDINGATIQIDPKVTSGVVLFFTSVRCPYDQYYLSRMNDIHARYGRNFRFYFVNSSPEDTPAAIQAALRNRESPITYLIDQQQAVKKAFGASKTTEVVVLKPEKGGFSMYYRGPVDDNPQVAADADKNFLRDALEGYLAGKPASQPGERVAGCLIREP